MRKEIIFMQSFNTPRIIFGNDSINSIQNETKNNKKILIISGKSAIRHNIIDKIKLPNKEVIIFSDVEPEPSINTLEKTIQLSKDCDLVIGIGGGSALDIAKATALLAKNPGDIENYLGINKVPNKGIKNILIPTTAGTGSEVTNVSVLLNKNQKVVIYSPYLFSNLAILDPSLTLTLPKRLTAETGIDALSHAIEAYTSTNANNITDSLSLKSIELIGKNIKKVIQDGNNLEARGNMLLASTLAGMSFINAGCNLNHALALAVGSKYNLPHGRSVAISLPISVKFNQKTNTEKFSNIINTLNLAGRPNEAIKNLLNEIGITENLGDIIKNRDIDYLAEKTLKAQRLIKNNPRQINQDNIRNMLEQAIIFS